METKCRSFSEINPFIREVGLQRCDSWCKRKRKIYDFEMMYCFCGNARAEIEEIQYDLVPGSLLLIPPDTSHRFWSDRDTHNECFYCHFDFIYQDDDTEIFDIYNDVDTYLGLFWEILPRPELIREVPLFEGNYSFPDFLQIKEVDRMTTLFRKLYKTYVSKSKIMSVTMKQIFLEIIQTVLAQTVEEDSYTSLNHRAIVESMKEYIANNDNRRVSVKEIADSVGLCSDHASRIFKKVTGMKMVEFITRHRISKAKTLMIYPNLTLDEIAHMVGFESENYFSQIVKRYEGQTPANLRISIYNEMDKYPKMESKEA